MCGMLLVGFGAKSLFSSFSRTWVFPISLTLLGQVLESSGSLSRKLCLWICICTNTHLLMPILHHTHRYVFSSIYLSLLFPRWLRARSISTPTCPLPYFWLLPPSPLLLVVWKVFSLKTLAVGSCCVKRLASCSMILIHFSLSSKTNLLTFFVCTLFHLKETSSNLLLHANFRFGIKFFYMLHMYTCAQISGDSLKGNQFLKKEKILVSSFDI